MRDDAPGSLYDARRLAPAAILIGGTLTVLELYTVFEGVDHSSVLAAFVPPVLGCAVIASSLARGNVPRAATATVVTVVGHMLLMVMMSALDGRISEKSVLTSIVAGGVLFVLTAIVAAPVVVAGVVCAGRRDLDAGDTMLSVSGGWLVALQTAAFLLIGGRSEPGDPSFYLALGLGFGGGALVLSVLQADARRRWCASVASGDVPGWRVRYSPTEEELANLPRMGGTRDGVMGVVERVESDGVVYRSAIVARPVAAVRVPHAVYAEGSSDA